MIVTLLDPQLTTMFFIYFFFQVILVEKVPKQIPTASSLSFLNCILELHSELDPHTMLDSTHADLTTALP